MSKRNTEPMTIARTDKWHVTYDRQTRDYAAFIDGDTLVLIGFFGTQIEAEAACKAYTFESLRRAA